VVRICITGIVLIATLVLASGSFGHVSAAATGPATIPISGQQTNFVRLNVGKPGRSPGDTEVLRQALFNRRVSSKAIGHSSVMCTYAIGRERLCRGTYFLPRGSLIVAGSITFRQVYELAVVGGTGLYDNARGTMTATRIKKSPPREFLLFRLVG
jgi:dirigent-like protein